MQLRHRTTPTPPIPSKLQTEFEKLKPHLSADTVSYLRPRTFGLCVPELGPNSQDQPPHLLAVLCTKSLQSCPTLCDPRDCSPPASSVHGILQARILEWVAVPSSRGSSHPGDQTRVSYISWHWQADSLPLVATGKPSCCFDQMLLLLLLLLSRFSRVRLFATP